ncbi:MAG: Glu-tRNA(Gln) amidotransferase subunit GatE [archaeon]|nr:Glu-tRNA(Gln) amidotransferase subunit GatE [archaeon]
MDYDYKALGFKCGLEIHQQLDTGKLFCRTPSLLRDDKPDYTIERKLRPVVSELGEFDRAALEAFKKKLTYIYEGYNDTISLVELDEEPPQPIDEDALKTILEVALISESNILDELFPMRKLVIDGSNTSGFQRTMLVATGGSIKLKNKNLGILSIAIEEDAARPMEKTDEYIVYRLDRLGIPLIELATAPDISNPVEAKEAALAIGNLMRITGKVKRGLGTIRQDLNISIKEGARIEIKGVQELAIIDEYVRREVQRQIKLVEIKKELEKRGVKKSTLKGETKNLSNLFSNTNSKVIKSALEKKNVILGLKLENFAGLIGKEIQPNRRFGTELANYVKIKTGLKGIFHSDEMPNYGISEKEIEETSKALGCKKDDAFVLVCAHEEKAKTALEIVHERCLQCLIGVPEETRGAIDEGNSEYLRPLPGAARMYPETDLESLIVNPKILKEIEKRLPMSVAEREKTYSKMGLNENHINGLKTSNYARFFEKKVKEGMDAKRLAVFLLEGLVEARRNGARMENLNEEILEEFFKLIHEGKITKEVQLELLVEKSKNPAEPLENLLNTIGATGAEKGEVEKVVKKVIEANKELVKAKGMGALGALMGDVMKELKGKASGKEISDALKKELSK